MVTVDCGWRRRRRTSGQVSVIFVSPATSNPAKVRTYLLSFFCASAGARSYIVTLERQLSHLRAELSDAYRSRSTSQDKQLRLTDTLRERDDEVRALKDEMRSMKERTERMSKREREHEERWKIKENDVQVSVRSGMSSGLEGDRLKDIFVCVRGCSTCTTRSCRSTWNWISSLCEIRRSRRIMRVSCNDGWTR